jgi:hypothetical protein
MYKNNISQNKDFKNEDYKIEGFKTIIETFDGIRKDNSRIIFGILLSIIALDVIMDCYNGLF